MNVKPVGTLTHIVPVMNFNVERVKRDGIPRPAEFTVTELESYYVTPDDAMRGTAGRKLSFQEAIQLFIV